MSELSDGVSEQTSATGEAAGKRLAPAVVVLWPLSQVVPLVFLLVTGRLPAPVAAALFAGLIAAAFVRWWRFTWRLERRALVIEHGLLARHRRVVPVDRIQSVDLVRPLRHRLLGVVEVRIEVIGDRSTEGRLEALTVRDAEILRATLLAARSGEDSDEPSPARPLVVVDPRTLVLAGVTGGRVGIAAALVGAVEQLLGGRVFDLFARLPGALGPAGLVLVGGGVVSGVFALSVGATVAVYWNFRLVRIDDELRVTRGLLEQRLQSLPLRRVQALRVEENIVRRALRLAVVKVDVAGKARGNDDRDTGLLLPLGSTVEASGLVAALLDRPALSDLTLQPMPVAALRLRLATALLGTVLVTAPAVALAGPPGLLVALIGVPWLLLARAAYRALGWAEADGVIVTRSGVLVRRTAFVPVARLHSLALRAGPLQQRVGLATLELQIPRSPGVWAGPRLLDVGRDTGEAVLLRLIAAVDVPSYPPGRAW